MKEVKKSDDELNTREMSSKNEKMKCKKKKDGARSWAYRGGHETL